MTYHQRGPDPEHPRAVLYQDWEKLNERIKKLEGAMEMVTSVLATMVTTYDAFRHDTGDGGDPA